MHTLYSGLAQVVVALHFGYLAYLISGGFIAWRWPRTIALHVAAAVWALLIVVTKVPCPLTALQNTLRERASQSSLGDSFVNTYVRGTLFPADRIVLAQAIVGLVVVGSWVGFAVVARPRRPRLHLPPRR